MILERKCVFCGREEGEHGKGCRLLVAQTVPSELAVAGGMSPEEHWNFLGELWGDGANDRLRELHDPDKCLKCEEGAMVANEKANVKVEGATIVRVRWMSEDEAELWYGWDSRTLILELDNGMTLIPAQDEEGNGPGDLFCLTEDKEEYAVWKEAERRKPFFEGKL